jgi:hypothetical protein
MIKPKTSCNPPKHIENLDKYKLPELKEFARERGLRVSGKKEELKQRIQENMNLHRNAIKVQRRFRGHMTRVWMRLKLGNKGTPVNDTDFYTMEPIEEMDFLYYINYTEEKSNTSYVFNVHSLMCLVAKTGKLHNPYTREDLTASLSTRLLRIINLTYIIVPENDLVRVNVINGINAATTPRTTGASTVFATQSALPINPNINYGNKAIELFTKIDELGNYTDVGWFNRMTNSQMHVFFIRMFHFWGHIDRDLRHRISPRRNIFSPTTLGIDSINDIRTLEENRALLLHIGEILVSDGETVEHRTLGAMYFLTVMTVVSAEARQNIPWLFDNYFVIINGG